MTDKELAEAVAKELGYEYRDCYFGDADRKGWCHKSTDEAFCHNDFLEECIFDWPVTSLMIENLYENGFRPHWEGNFVAFYKLEPRGIPRHLRTTESYSTDGITPHKAIAKAYLEAQEIIRNESRLSGRVGRA